jgi:hypothetical protein
MTEAEWRARIDSPLLLQSLRGNAGARGRDGILIDFELFC